MLSDILTPPYREWFIRGFAIGADLGLGAGIFLYWYFLHGPGAAGMDGGELHALTAVLLGCPFSLVPLEIFLPAWLQHLWVFTAIMLSWGTVAGTLTCLELLVVRRFKLVR